MIDYKDIIQNYPFYPPVSCTQCTNTEKPYVCRSWCTNPCVYTPKEVELLLQQGEERLRVVIYTWYQKPLDMFPIMGLNRDSLYEMLQYKIIYAVTPSKKSEYCVYYDIETSLCRVHKTYKPFEGCVSLCTMFQNNYEEGKKKVEYSKALYYEWKEHQELIQDIECIETNNLFKEI